MNQSEKTHYKPLAAWQGNGIGAAWERHGIYELAFRLPEFLDNW
jgi:hypothetical protein